MAPTRLAFLYSRFSNSEQQHGRSERRQGEQALDYCKRHGLTPDPRTFHDFGVSGFHGANATHGGLAEFLELVREGRIPEGSTLVIENTDRLSRLPPHEANRVIMAIVEAGVDIATTSPEQIYTKKNIRQIGTWIPLQVAQALAHEESLKKSDRLADAWAAKRATAGRKRLSRKGPAWLKPAAGGEGWVVLEDKAAWVRQIFRLALEGRGTAQIAGELHKIAPQGLTGRGWQPSYIHCLLHSRSVLGEFQPHVGTCAKKGTKATRKPHGEPIRGYFPAIISEADFILARQALGGRRKGGGKVSGVPNLFTGILRDARDDCRLVLNASHGRKVLVSAGAVRKLAGSLFRAVAYEPFERAILSCLSELSPRDIVAEPAPGEDAVALLSGRLTIVNQKLEQVKARADREPDVTVFLDLLADLDRQRRALVAELDDARAEAARHGADTLGDTISLITLLDEAAGAEKVDLRRKIRARLRQLVSGGWVLIMSTAGNRLAAVQLHFRDGGRRDYLIGIRNGNFWVRSLADVAALGPLDLRRPDDARRLEATLLAVDLDQEHVG